MNYYVFQVSDVEEIRAYEWFRRLVEENNVWGFTPRANNRKAITEGDKALFYLTGAKNQVFVGSATLVSGAYEDESEESKKLFTEPGTLRIDLKDVVVFPKPKPRKEFRGLEWRPMMGSTSRISERDFNIVVGAEPDTLSIEQESDSETEFALEKYLENFIVDNWDKIDFGERLKLFEDENGNSGQQYYTGEVGYIDILARDEDGNFVVFELKKGRKNDEVIGQVLRYIGWVRERLAKNKEGVRGVIVVGERDSKLEFALKEISDKVSVKLYKISFRLEPY